MSNYTLQIDKLYDKQRATSLACEYKKSSCAGMETGPLNRQGALQVSMDWLKKNVQSRYGVVPVLAVGDTLEVFEFPTYARLEDLSVFHDCPLGDFRFQVEVADVIDGDAGLRTVTPRAGIVALNDTEVGTTVTNDATAGAIPVLGATAGRDHFHFGNEVRNNHRAVIRLRVTAAPAVPAAGNPPAASFFDYAGLNLFARFEKYASCVCAPTCQGGYDKDLVTAVA